MKAKQKKNSSQLNSGDIKDFKKTLLSPYEIMDFMLGQQQLECKAVSISATILSWLVR